MAKKIAGALFFLVTISIFAIAIAKKKPIGRKIYVDWETGFNNTEWVAKNGQTYVNDTLVFHYPDDCNNYTVYSMKRFSSNFDCDFSYATATLLADTTAGAGRAGFPFVLANGYSVYFFACINHCKPGGKGMQLAVNPIPHQ